MVKYNMYREGKWNRKWFREGNDSYLHGIRHNSSSKLETIDRISLATVFVPQPEPIYRQHTVTVKMVKGGKITNVAWPGAQVNMGPGGIIPGGVALGIHGLWESPLAGQQVLLGWVEGSSSDPIVINKYPYNALQRPDLEAMHSLPLTLQAHGPTDVVLGHYLGSFIALRGTLPLPAQIDIVSLSGMTVTVAAFFTVATIAQCSFTVGGLFSVVATGNITMSGATMVLTSAGAVTITAVPSVIINTGTRAVAAMGDLTPTLLGPSPITATGTALLVP